MADMLGVALFGLGRAGSIHFGNIISNFRIKLLYIVEKDVEKAQNRVKKYGINNSVKVLDPMDAHVAYEDDKVKAVIVAAPTFEHEDIVTSALKHGKGVFCEKPISETLDGTRKCYEAAEKAGKPLWCSFNRRFDPSLTKLKSRVDAGECGTILSVKTVGRSHPLPPLHFLRTCGGLFHDMAVHDMDLICWILGQYPHTVFTLAHAHHDVIKSKDDTDQATTVMKFPNNVVATIDTSRHACYGIDQRCEVFGMDAMFVSENQRPTEIVAFTKTGAISDPLKYSFAERYYESFINALNEFVDVMEGKKEVQISKQHALSLSVLASACEHSYKTGAPVTFDPATLSFK